VNRQKLIDELTAIVAIEHALIVDNLQISYALGTHRDDVVTPLGPASPEGREAAGEARSIAINDMRHLKSLYEGQLMVGGRPQLGRATHVQPLSGPVIPLCSVSAAEFATFEARQHAVAETVDARFTALAAALPRVDPPLDAELTQRLEGALGFAANHAERVEQLVAPIRLPSPAHHLRAKRIEATTDLERSLVAVSDEWYQTLVAMVEGWLAHDELMFDLSGRAGETMTALDDFNAVLVGRGLIAPFHL
jgi:hypothetical protein